MNLAGSRNIRNSTTSCAAPGNGTSGATKPSQLNNGAEVMKTGTIDPNLSSILREHRVFPPPAEFAAQAHVKSLEEYETLYRRSIQDPEAFWAEIAAELHWFAPWTKVLDWNPPVGQVVCRAAKSISATTASIATLSATERTKSRFCGRASRERSAGSPTGNSTPRSRSSRTCSKASGFARATGLRFTWA